MTFNLTYEELKRFADQVWKAGYDRTEILRFRFPADPGTWSQVAQLECVPEPAKGPKDITGPVIVAAINAAQDFLAEGLAVKHAELKTFKPSRRSNELCYVELTLVDHDGNMQIKQVSASYQHPND